MSRPNRLLGITAALGVAALALTACSSGTAAESTGVDASTATSLSDFGTFDDLVAAAQAEGSLNVIALPRDWANYGQIIDNFTAEYGITVNELQPGGSSADEIAAARNNEGLDTAPDVFNLGDTIANSSTKYFAEYRNDQWDDFADSLKNPEGLFVAGEGGFMSIGYDSAAVPTPTTFQDLLKPEYKGVVISGDPTQNAIGLAGVALATLQEDGTLDDVQPGIDFFAQLSDTGNLINVQPSAATVTSGETKVVISYDYSNAAYGRDLPTWKVAIPEGIGYGNFLYQAISKTAPHPAAARLWQEFLYQPEQQNLWIQSGARSPLADQLIANGTIDQAALDALPAAPAEFVIPTVKQSEDAGILVSTEWASAVG